MQRALLIDYDPNSFWRFKNFFKNENILFDLANNSFDIQFLSSNIVYNLIIISVNSNFTENLDIAKKLSIETSSIIVTTANTINNNNLSELINNGITFIRSSF